MPKYKVGDIVTIPVHTVEIPGTGISITINGRGGAEKGVIMEVGGYVPPPLEYNYVVSFFLSIGENSSMKIDIPIEENYISPVKANK